MLNYNDGRRTASTLAGLHSPSTPVDPTNSEPTTPVSDTAASVVLPRMRVPAPRCNIAALSRRREQTIHYLKSDLSHGAGCFSRPVGPARTAFWCFGAMRRVWVDLD